MWREFVKMYITTDDILLTETLTHKPVHILCPLFYFGHSFERGIFQIIAGFIYHVLIPECQLPYRIL